MCIWLLVKKKEKIQKMYKFPCYIHIEKCAGTTLHHSLKYRLPGYVVLRPWFYWSNDEGSYLTANELKLLKRFFPILSGIGGHTARTYIGYESVIKKPISYFTFLREPIARYMSHYNHQVNKMGINWSIEEFINDARFSNFITRRIAGSEDLELAKCRLLDDYDFVGLFEYFDESLVMLKHFSFNGELDLFYERRNESLGEQKACYSEFSKEIQDRIYQNNKIDIALYDFVLQEIFPKQKNAYPASLSEALLSFEKENKKYRYNAFRYEFLRSTRLYTDKVAQKISHFLAGAER